MAEGPDEPTADDGAGPSPEPATTPAPGPAAVQPTNAPAGDRPDEEPRPADSDTADAEESGYDPEEDWRLRFDREQGRRNFSWTPFDPNASRTVKDGHGVFSQGDSSPAAEIVYGHMIGSINVGLGRRPHLVQQVSRQHLDDSTTGFVQELRNDRTTVLDELTARLSSGRVVVLVGPPGSGRTALAVRGLHAVLSPVGLIAIFSLSIDPDQLREMNLRQDDGYVVDVRPAATRRPLDDVMADLAGYAEQRQTKIVVVVDTDRLPAGWADYPLVRHAAPDRWLVLRTLLIRVHGLSEDQTGALPSSIMDEIGIGTMAGLAQAATAVAAALRASKAPGAYLRQVVRQQVARKFDQPTEPTDEDHEVKAVETDSVGAGMSRAERAHAFRRCCMLSAAAFNGLSLSAVTAAAAELSNVLRADDPDAPAVSNLFEQPVDLLLGWLEADLMLAPDVATPKRLEFRNPAVPDVVLEHVWTSHHLASASITDWLDRLARLHRDGPNWPAEVRLRAAQAVGRLATYDFARVVDTVIEEWIKTGTGSSVQATAWAVEVMADDPRIASAAWERVRIWSLRGQRWRRAALVVYASALQQRQTTDALDLVQRVVKLSTNLDYAVAAVLRSAVLAGAQKEVFEILAGWLRQIEQARERGKRLRLANELQVISSLPSHAARSLVLLGTGGDAGTRQHLLAAADADPAFSDTVVALWRLALSDPAVARRATELLESWLRESDTDDGLARTCERLLGALSRDPSLRRRLWFHASRWIVDWSGAFPAAEHLLKNTLRNKRGSEEGTTT